MKTPPFKQPRQTGILPALGFLLGLAACSHGAIAVGINDTFDSSEVWFGNPNESVSGGVLVNTLVDPTFQTMGRTTDSILSLGVGETLSLSFDINRDANITVGNLRVYLMRDAAATSPHYGFYTGFGASTTSRIGYDNDSASTAGALTKSYTTGSSSPAVAVTGSGFTTIEFTIDRVDLDTLSFNLIQDSTSLASVTKVFDGVDQPVADLFTTFNRIYIGWTDSVPAPEGGWTDPANIGADGVSAAFYLDNVKMEIIPEPSAALLGGLGLLALLRRRRD
jgi:hypothetical protein